MSNERPDEFLEWRSQLSQPEALPEMGLENREAAWERLSTRMGKARLPVYRYAAIAALLLLTLTSIAFLFRGRESPSAGRSFLYGPAKTEDPGTVRGLERAGATIPITAMSQVVPTVNAPSAQSSARLKRRSSNKNTLSVSQAVPTAAAINVDPQTKTLPVSIGPSPNPPVDRQIAQQTPPRKQLRVVCLNEIGSSEPPAPALTSGNSVRRTGSWSGTGAASMRITISLPGLVRVTDGSPGEEDGRALKFTFSQNH